MRRFYNLTAVTSHEPERTAYFEVLISVQPIIISVLLRNILFVIFPKLLQYPRLRNILEYFLVVFPFLCFAFDDIYPDWKYTWMIFLMGVAFAIPLYFVLLFCVLYRTRHSSVLPMTLPGEESNYVSNCSTCMRQYRAVVYIATMICILGRDLGAFRVRYAKSFVFGTGLMDTGVGCFIMAMGMISITTRIDRAKINQLNKFAKLMQNFNIFVILILIGFIKTMVGIFADIKSSETEYGVHWNVFYTLAVVKFIGTAVELYVCNRIPPLIIALVISLSYEIVLESWLKMYIFTAGRLNFLSSNREGISQLAGLLALYLWGAFAGRRIYNFNGQAKTLKCVLFLGFVAFMTGLIGFIGKHYQLFERESRRCANFSYVLWMVTFSTCMLGEIFLTNLLFENILRKLKRPDFTQNSFLVLLDKHGFTFFIIGNLMTGIINAVIEATWSLERQNKSGYSSICIELLYLYLTALISIKLPPIQSIFSRCCNRTKK